MSHSINSILLLSNTMSKANFANVEIAKEIKQYKNGNVVAVLSTLNDLSKGKFQIKLNKSGVAQIPAFVEYATLSKSNHKSLSFALALVDIISPEFDAGAEPIGECLCNITKNYQTAYTMAKDVKKASVKCQKPSAVTTTTESEELPEATITTVAPKISALSQVLALLPSLDSEDLTELEIAILTMTLPVSQAMQEAMTAH
jgi:hypothetical protein